MNKGKKISRKIGIGLALTGVILSFFPLIRLTTGPKTIIQLLKIEEFMNIPIGLGKITIAFLLLGMLTHLTNFVKWFYKKTGSDLNFAIINLIISLLSVFIPTFLFMTVQFDIVAYPMPVTGWLLLRTFISLLEIVNKAAGEGIINALRK